jgi:hypothetical protein
MCDYAGRKLPGNPTVVTADGWSLPAEGIHSPHGFEWGYEGAGPAELARALLRHHLGDRIPHPFIYQRVMRTVVRKFALDAWALTSVDLEKALQEALRHHGRTCPLCADCGYRQIDGNREDACECALGRRLFNAAMPKTAHAGARK